MRNSIMMNRTLIAVALLLLPFKILAQGVCYTYEDSLTICRLLNDKDVVESEGKVLALAKKFIGIPYVPATLEINDEEKLVVNTRQFDCTTFVETVCALFVCKKKGVRDFDGYCHQLRSIRYREGKLSGYESRLHYFSDWIADNQQLGFVKELQEPVPPFTAHQCIIAHFMSSHPDKYKALKNNPLLVRKIRDVEHRISGNACSFIPKAMLSANRLLSKVIANGDILAITCNIEGLEIAHLGFAVWVNDTLHLLHASSKNKKVCVGTVSLSDYLMKNRSFTGVRVVRLL